MAIITKNGIKLYPVGNWQKNQHKLYNYHDKMSIKAHEEDTDEAWDTLYESEKLLDVFNTNVYDGIVYAPYKDYCKLKDIIGYYDLTH